MNYSKISIIGAGPAGIATAIQLKRFGYKPRLFERKNIGGLLWNANLVENYPGFPNGIEGKKLIHLMEKHLTNLEIEVSFEEINNISLDGEQFIIKSGQNEYLSDYVVIATGTKPKADGYNIPNPIRKNRIYHDVSELLGIKEKKVIIIGAGDAAFDHALYLGKNNIVTIINRGDKIKALNLLVDRVISNPSISYFENICIKCFDIILNSETTDRSQLRIIGTSQNINKEFICDYVVFAFGREPQLDFVESQMLNNNKCFLVGDVLNGSFRQASIAIGNGVEAAMKIHQMILNEES